jgi:ATP synthase subunit 6
VSVIGVVNKIQGLVFDKGGVSLSTPTYNNYLSELVLFCGVKFTVPVFLSIVLVVLVLSYVMINTPLNPSGKSARFLNSSSYLYSTVRQIFRDVISGNAGKVGMRFAGLFGNLAYLLFVLNVLSMLPFTFTLVAQLVISAGFGGTVFFCLNAVSIYAIKLRLPGLFVPTFCPLVLLPLLIFVEFVGYNSRLVSLSVRMFCNIMSGHMLSKILSSFTFLMFTSGSLSVIISGSVVYLFTFVIAVFEFFVSAVQSYIFIVLTSVYLNDVLAVSSLMDDR